MAKSDRDNKNLPVRASKCATCPFRRGSKYEYLRADLEKSALTEGSRICHSTGANNAINRRTGVPSHICRGARDVQLVLLHQMGALDSPTDKAWNKRREESGLPPQVIKDPEAEKRICQN